MDAGKVIRFDGWRLDCQSGELLKDGMRVRLQTHPQQVLEALLERPGELVTREQLIARLWPKGVVDFDTALNSTVRRLRIALGDDAETPRYIETLPRRGYRFIGKAEPPPAPVTEMVSPSVATGTRPVRSTLRSRRAVAAVAVSVLAAAAVAHFSWTRDAPQGDSRGQVPARSRAQAQEAYGRAKFLLDRRGPTDIERALQYFDDAIRHDPTYALAWSGQASANWIQLVEGRIPRAQGLSRVRDAAERALQLDPTLAEAHLRLANYRSAVGDPAAAAKHVQRATELEPRNPLVLSFAAGEAANAGRLADAVALQRRAVEADPLSAVVRFNLASMLYVAGRFDEAEAELRRLRELAPAMPGVDAMLGLVLVQQGRPDEALSVVAGGSADVLRLQVLALANFASGREAEADRALRILQATCLDDERHLVAEVYAYRGEVDQAFAWLQPTPTGAPDSVPWYLAQSPLLKVLRGDPRWRSWTSAS